MGETNGAAPPKLLLVEDDQSIVRMLRLTLRAAGFAVTEAATGGEALRVLKQEPVPVEAVVLDLGLPDGLGAVVLQRLHRLRRQTNSRPVWVVVSALNREEAAQRYGALGDHFLAKPFDPWHLVRLLEGLLRGES